MELIQAHLLGQTDAVQGVLAGLLDTSWQKKIAAQEALLKFRDPADWQAILSKGHNLGYSPSKAIISVLTREVANWSSRDISRVYLEAFKPTSPLAQQKLVLAELLDFYINAPFITSSDKAATLLSLLCSIKTVEETKGQTTPTGPNNTLVYFIRAVGFLKLHAARHDLYRLLKTPSDDIQYEILNALTLLGGTHPLKIYLTLFESPNPKVVSAAVRLLTHSLPDFLTEILLKMFYKRAPANARSKLARYVKWNDANRTFRFLKGCLSFELEVSTQIKILLRMREISTKHATRFLMGYIVQAHSEKHRLAAGHSFRNMVCGESEALVLRGAQSRNAMVQRLCLAKLHKTNNVKATHTLEQLIYTPSLTPSENQLFLSESVCRVYENKLTKSDELKVWLYRQCENGKLGSEIAAASLSRKYNGRCDGFMANIVRVNGRLAVKLLSMVEDLSEVKGRAFSNEPDFLKCLENADLRLRHATASLLLEDTDRAGFTRVWLQTLRESGMSRDVFISLLSRFLNLRSEFIQWIPFILEKDCPTSNPNECLDLLSHLLENIQLSGISRAGWHSLVTRSLGNLTFAKVAQDPFLEKQQTVLRLFCSKHFDYWKDDIELFVQEQSEPFIVHLHETFLSLSQDSQRRCFWPTSAYRLIMHKLISGHYKEPVKIIELFSQLDDSASSGQLIDWIFTSSNSHKRDELLLAIGKAFGSTGPKLERVADAS